MLLLSISFDKFQPATRSPPTAKPLTYIPSMVVSPFPTTDPIAAPFQSTTYAPSLAGSSGQSSIPSQVSIIVEGILTFQLMMEYLLENNVAAFEMMAEDFLQERLASALALNDNSIVFSSYNVTVTSQTLVPRKLTNAENKRARMLGGSTILFVVTTVTAVGEPAELACDFPFQAAIDEIVSESGDEFYDNLFSSDAFKGMQPTQSLENIELQGSDVGINKALVLGGSVAGVAVLLSLVIGLFAVRKNRERQAGMVASSRTTPPAARSVREVDEELGLPDSSDVFRFTPTPKTIPPFIDEEGNDLSSLEDSLEPAGFPRLVSHEDINLSDDSLDPTNISCEEINLSYAEDSLNPDNYPQNVQNFPYAFEGDLSTKSNADDDDQQIEEWSLDDNFPLLQDKNRPYVMNHSYMTNSDGDSSTTLSITITDLDGSFLSYVDDACTIQTDQDSRSMQSHIGTVDEGIPSARNALKLGGKNHKKIS